MTTVSFQPWATESAALPTILSAAGSDEWEGQAVPRISEFHGIIVEMFHNDHPPLHFHATYGEHGATFGIDPVVRIEGRLPRNVERMVLEWAELHQDELRENWAMARALQPLRSIEPLP